MRLAPPPPYRRVKVAIHEPTGSEVAVKVMNKEDIRNKDLTVSVRREVAIMKALRHKHIVSLHRVLSSSTRLYVIMDLVYGSDLADHIAAAEEAGDSITEEKARVFFRQIVDGVVHCHERRVYHRDLKVRGRLLRAVLLPVCHVNGLLYADVGEPVPAACVACVFVWTVADGRATFLASARGFVCLLGTALTGATSSVYLTGCSHKTSC